MTTCQYICGIFSAVNFMFTHWNCNVAVAIVHDLQILKRTILGHTILVKTVTQLQDTSSVLKAHATRHTVKFCGVLENIFVCKCW